MEAYNPESRFT